MKCCLLAVLALSQSSFAHPIELMTFNIRYGTANDGENSWEFRKDHVVDTIKDSAPWAFAIQEALLGQLQYIDELLPQYTKVGTHRTGITKGEFSGLLVDTSKLEILDDGQLWLSEQPEAISKGWDAALERTATWAKVREVGTTSPTFILFSTHFDHRGEQARLESAKLLVKTAEELCKGEPIPIAIMGDFNFSPGSTSYKVFTFAGYHPAVQPEAEVGTFHAFSGKTNGKRIDYIFLNDFWKVENSKILRPRKNGKSASDHDPIITAVSPLKPAGTIGMNRSIKDGWTPSRDSLVRSLIPIELLHAVAKVEKLISTRPDIESDYHELSHVYGAFKNPLHLTELAGELTDRLMVLHCEPSNVQALVAKALDAVPIQGKMLFDSPPSIEKILEFLSIPNETFYIEGHQLNSAIEIIQYSRQVDFNALVETIQIPTEEKQYFFGKAMPSGVTGTVLAGQRGPDGWRVVGGKGTNTYDMSIVEEVFDLGGR